MKLSKKILLAGTALLAFGLGVSSCAIDEDEHKILNVKGDTASIDYKNDTNVTHRGFRTLKTKHTDAVAVFTIDSSKSEKRNDGRTGVMGFVFDLQKNDVTVSENNKNVNKTVYDFTTVSVRVSSNNVESYISRFYNVDPNQMDAGDNFKGLNGNEAVAYPDSGSLTNTTAYEKVILKGTGNDAAYATISAHSNGNLATAGVYKLAAEVIANENDGTYSVKFYTADSVAEAHKDENGTKTGQIKQNGATQLNISGQGATNNVCTVDASWKTESNKSSAKQQDMGFYAGVYPSAKFVGSIQLPYILNEDEVVEWED